MEMRRHVHKSNTNVTDNACTIHGSHGEWQTEQKTIIKNINGVDLRKACLCAIPQFRRIGFRTPWVPQPSRCKETRSTQARSAEIGRVNVHPAGMANESRATRLWTRRASTNIHRRGAPAAHTWNKKSHLQQRLLHTRALCSCAAGLRKWCRQ